MLSVADRVIPSVKVVVVLAGTDVSKARYCLLSRAALSSRSAIRYVAAVVPRLQITIVDTTAEVLDGTAYSWLPPATLAAGAT
jgi:hypothetical protein